MSQFRPGFKIVAVACVFQLLSSGLAFAAESNLTISWQDGDLQPQYNWQSAEQTQSVIHQNNNLLALGGPSSLQQSGDVRIESGTTNMNVIASDQSILEFSSFNIPSDKVTYINPASSSTVNFNLNPSSTWLLGTITSSGGLVVYKFMNNYDAHANGPKTFESFNQGKLVETNYFFKDGSGTSVIKTTFDKNGKRKDAAYYVQGANGYKELTHYELYNPKTNVITTLVNVKKGTPVSIDKSYFNAQGQITKKETFGDNGAVKTLHVYSAGVVSRVDHFDANGKMTQRDTYAKGKLSTTKRFDVVTGNVVSHVQFHADGYKTLEVRYNPAQANQKVSETYYAANGIVTLKRVLSAETGKVIKQESYDVAGKLKQVNEYTPAGQPLVVEKFTADGKLMAVHVYGRDGKQVQLLKKEEELKAYAVAKVVRPVFYVTSERKVWMQFDPSQVYELDLLSLNINTHNPEKSFIRMTKLTVPVVADEVIIGYNNIAVTIGGKIVTVMLYASGPELPARPAFGGTVIEPMPIK